MNTDVAMQSTSDGTSVVQSTIQAEITWFVNQTSSEREKSKWSVIFLVESDSFEIGVHEIRNSRDVQDRSRVEKLLKTGRKVVGVAPGWTWSLKFRP